MSARGKKNKIPNVVDVGLRLSSKKLLELELKARHDKEVNGEEKDDEQRAVPTG